MPTFGKTTDGTNVQTFSGDRMYICQGTPSSSGQVVRGFGKVRVTATGQSEMRMVIYADNAGEPGNFLAQSDEVVVNWTTSTLTEFAFSGDNQIDIVGGTPYWIGFWADDPGTPSYEFKRDNTAGLVRYKASAYPAATPTSPFSADGSSAGLLNAYIEYTESVGGGDFEISDLSSASSIDNVVIEHNGGNFEIADLSSVSNIDNITIEQSGSLEVQNIEATSNIENIDLEQNGGTLEIGEIYCATEIDNLGLEGNFIIDGMTCGTVTEEITLEFEVTEFVIDEMVSTSTVENIPLIGEFIIQDINAPPTIENITLEIAKGDFVIGDLDSSSAITNIRIVKDIPDELKTIFIVNRGKVAKWISGNNYIEL